MTKIAFPINTFKKEKNYTPEIFSNEAMILTCINAYFSNNILSQILGQNYSLKKVFKYFLEDFEIYYLGRLEDEEKDKYFDENFYSIPYDFCLSNKKRRYRGIIEIKTNFVDKNSLENSFFNLKINVCPEVDLLINFDNLSEENTLNIAEEFLEKTWKAIFKVLKRQEFKQSKAENHKKETDYLLTTNISKDLNITNKIIELVKDEGFILNDSITDIFHILFNESVCSEFKGGHFFISADEILTLKDKKKNINSKGNRGGFKEKLKQKVHKDILFLSFLGIINFQEIEKYNYSISFNRKVFNEHNIIYPIQRKLISYNPKTHFWHKRIGEYLSFNNYISGQKHIVIKSQCLTDLIKAETTSLKPSLIREKLENTLDTLSEDGIISGWEYKKINEEELKGKDWFIKYSKIKLKISF